MSRVTSMTTRPGSLYYYAGNILAAESFTGATGLTIYCYHSDHLGSTRVMTRNDGQPRTAYDYSAFGDKDQSGTVYNERTYTGHVEDPDYGLIYMVARYYDAVLGRFISPDSIVPDMTNPQALNRFSYVVNNPLNITDPTGHDLELDPGQDGDKPHDISTDQPDRWQEFTGVPGSRDDWQGWVDAAEAAAAVNQRIQQIVMGIDYSKYRHNLNNINWEGTRLFSNLPPNVEKYLGITNPKCPGTFLDRSFNNWLTTNLLDNGMAFITLSLDLFTDNKLLSALPGIGVSAITSGSVAAKVDGITALGWAFSGLKGFTLGGTAFTGVETGIISVGTWATNAVMATVAYQAGVALGSLVQASPNNWSILNGEGPCGCK